MIAQKCGEKGKGLDFCLLRCDFYVVWNLLELDKGINTKASSSKTNNDFDFTKAMLLKIVQQHMLSGQRFHTCASKSIFRTGGKLGNVVEKNQKASFGGYTTILKQLCLWVKGHAGFSISNVFSTAFVTDPASVSNYAHKSKLQRRRHCI